MTPQAIALLIQLVELAIQEEPAIALELHNIFTTPNPSAADWQALREKVLGESFEALAPNAAANLPPEIVTPPAETAGTASPDATAPTSEPALEASDVTADPATDLAAEIPAVAGVLCPQCGTALIPNSPANCSCAS